jgi:AraC-like DNA-binding protein
MNRGENNAPAYLEFAPPRELQPFVERLWVHRIEGPPPTEGRRLLPDGRMYFVWHGALGVRISGPQTHYTSLPDAPRILAFGAAFHPGAAPNLLRTRASALVNDQVALDAVLPRLAARLDDRLGHARDPREALTALADELSLRVRLVASPNAAVREAVRMLNLTTTTVADVAARAFVSERELQRRFVEHIGYGPKTLQRILRFQRFMQQLGSPQIGLAGAAALAGYADQSHLSRETRRLADMTPRQLTRWTH